MEVRARLIATHEPEDPEAAVVVVHGGGGRAGNPAVRPTQLSVLRMVPVAQRLARVGKGRLAVYRLLNSTRGWDSRRTPVDDASWALDQVRERLGTVPVGLVGHSLGGRAALLAAHRPEVESLVLLTPWVYPTDGQDLGDRPVLVIHGTEDRVASQRNALAVATAMAEHGPVSFVSVDGGKHSMLARRSAFDHLAADFMAATLLGDAPEGVVARALAGERVIEI